MKKDRIFTDKKSGKNDFKFDKKTAGVFDDMLERSVPFYSEVQRMVAELVKGFISDDTNIYDLGCSTGTTLELLAKSAKGRKVNMVGLDLSEPMLEKARAKLQKIDIAGKLDLKKADLNDDIEIGNACIAIMFLTLQFVRPLNRDRLMKNIYDGLNRNGCLILVEKILGNNSLFNRLYIDLYYDYKKRHGYSQMEIAQKREALENVLIPYRLDENIELLKRNGFRSTEVFFKWYNFCGLIAVKD